MNKTKSSADHVEIHRRLQFLSMFLLSLIFAVKTGHYLVDDENSSYLRIAGYSVFLLFAIVFIITVYWKLRHIPRKDRYELLSSSDSFVMQVMNKAFKISWFITLILIVALTTSTSKDYSTFPTEFYLNLILFVMLAVFSTSFFVNFHGGIQPDA